MSALAEVFERPPHAGVSAVLDAADAVRDQLSEFAWLASFAPPPIYYAQCPCGSVFEIRPGDPNYEITPEDREAIADWDDAHAYCGDDL